MSQLVTDIALPPGRPAAATVRDLLRLCLETFRWFVPARYGTSLANNEIVAGAWLDTLVTFYDREGKINVADVQERQQLYLLPDKPGRRSYLGTLSWFTPKKLATNKTWRANHAGQIAAVMQLLDSPLAIAAYEEDIHRKSVRWVREGAIEKRTHTLRDYSEGLTGLYWRNFFGPPYTDLFGEALDNPPVGRAEKLANQLWLVEPYDLPGQAEQARGQECERLLIEHLGKSCFYDFEQDRKPTRRPALPPLEEEQPAS